MRRTILAVGHDAYRAGAQIAFLHVLRWLREHHDGDLRLVLKADGDLLPAYAEVLPTTALASLGPARPGPLHTARRRFGRGSPAARVSLSPGSVDVVYANCAAAADLGVELAARAGSPLVLHVHELEMSLRRFAPTFPQLRDRIDGFIAVSGAVARNLIDGHGIDPTRVHLVNEGIAVPAVLPTAAERAQARAELGLPADAFVVGGCGTVDWRKGADLFLLVAKAFERRRPGAPVRFVWVGGEPAEMGHLRHDLEGLGLGEVVQLAGPQADPSRHFATFDAFLLSSREDPFPLVCLETAALGVPQVCFAGAGGMPELVEADAGYVVPYLDIEAAADRLHALATDPAVRATLGRRAAEKVRERCDIAVVGAQIAAVLDRYAGGPAAAPNPAAAVLGLSR